MEISTKDIGEIIAASAAFLAAMFGGMKLVIYSSTRGLHKKMDNFKSDNLEQHNKIFKSLIIVEDSVVRKEIIDELRSVARGYIHYNKLIDNTAKILIDSQCERAVEVAEEIMNENFTQEMYDQTVVKIENECNVGRVQVLHLYGEEFLKKYTEAQKVTITEFLAKLNKIVNDGVTNSKYEKFKSAIIAFLHDIISETLLIIHDWEKSKQT